MEKIDILFLIIVFLLGSNLYLYFEIRYLSDVVVKVIIVYDHLRSIIIKDNNNDDSNNFPTGDKIVNNE